MKHTLLFLSASPATAPTANPKQGGTSYNAEQNQNKIETR